MTTIREDGRLIGEGDLTRLILRGEIDIAAVDDLLADFLSEVDGSSELVEIDCSDLEFIDSSGLRMLVQLREQTGAQIVLVGVPKKCRRTFEITNLDHVFELRDA